MHTLQRHNHIYRQADIPTYRQTNRHTYSQTSYELSRKSQFMKVSVLKIFMDCPAKDNQIERQKKTSRIKKTIRQTAILEKLVYEMISCLVLICFRESLRVLPYTYQISCSF